jgi:hypothetical protein
MVRLVADQLSEKVCILDFVVGGRLGTQKAVRRLRGWRWRLRRCDCDCVGYRLQERLVRVVCNSFCT